MALTSDDLKAIQNAIMVTVQPMIDDAVEDLAQRAAAGFEEVHQNMAEHDKRFEQIDRGFEQVDRRFDEIDRRFESVEGRLGRIEDKLDPTINQVEDHSVRLRKLEAKAA